MKHARLSKWRSVRFISLLISVIYIYCVNCMKSGQLILGKVIQIVATRCHILRLKCTKFDIGWGSAPDPAGRAYSAPLNPLAGFKGAYI